LPLTDENKSGQREADEEIPDDRSVLHYLRTLKSPRHSRDVNA
jgi:hypothetical protein